MSNHKDTTPATANPDADTNNCNAPGTTVWESHRQMLRERAIDPAYAERLGESVDLRELRRQREKYGKDGWKSPYPNLPLHAVTVFLIRYQACLDGIERLRARSDFTSYVEHGPMDGAESHGARTVEVKRYICQAGVSVVPFHTPEVLAVAGDTSVALFGTEAPLKAMSLSCNGFPAFGMGGVLAGGHDPKELKDSGEIVASPELRRINWRGRRLYIVYDASLTNPKKPLVSLGAAYLGIALRNLGADVWLVRLPEPHPTEADIERGEFYVATDTGPDDYIARHGKAAFQRLVDEAEPLDPSDRIARWTGKTTEKAVRVAALLSDLPTLAYLHAADPATNARFHAITKSALGAKEIRAAVTGYAARLKPKAEELGEWVAKMKFTKAGGYEPSTHNALLVLRNDARIKGLLAQDDMLGAPVVRRQPPWDAHDWVSEREFSDSDAVRLAAWLDEQWGMKLTTKSLHELVDAAAAEHRFHPVRDWLETLAWDGVPRLSTWMTDILGAAPTPFVQVVSRKALIQMVARAYEPGCLAKSAVVLEGDQDEQKSTATRELVPNPTWWTDQLPADLSDKDASQALRGIWSMELPELVSKKRSDVDAVKAYLSRLFDRYRPSFGRRTIRVARSCVFWGTTNEDAYLVDATGNVRWWPVRVGVVHKIDIEKLKELRAQLFAEAVVAYKAKEPWWLTTEEEKAMARQETETRRHPDAWEPKFAEALAPLDRVTIAELLSTALDIPVKAQTPTDMHRAARILQKSRWRRSSVAGEEGVYLRPEGTKAGDAKEAASLCVAEEQALRTLQTQGWTVTHGVVNGQRVRIVTQPTDDEANVIQLLQSV